MVSKSKKLIAIDVDETIFDQDIIRRTMADFGIEEFVIETYSIGDELPKKVANEIFRKFDLPEWNVNPAVISGARFAVRELKKAGHDVVFVTARSLHVKEATEAMIEKYFGEFDHKGVLLTNRGEKGSVLKSIGATVLIDDSPKQLRSARLYGVETVLISTDDTPWNYSEVKNKEFVTINSMFEVPEIVDELIRKSKSGLKKA